MATTLTSLLEGFRSLIHDDGDIIVMEHAVGEINGTNKLFVLPTPPIIADSETVYVGGVVKTRTTEYSVSASTGLITFTAAPGAVVEASYQSVVYGDSQLLVYLASALDRLRTTDYDPAKEWELAADDDTLNVTLEEEQRALLLAQAALLVVEAEARRSLRRSGIKLTANIGIDRTNEAPNYTALLKQYRDDFDAMLKRMTQAQVIGWRVPTGMEKSMSTGGGRAIEPLYD